MPTIKCIACSEQIKLTKSTVDEQTWWFTLGTARFQTGAVMVDETELEKFLKDSLAEIQEKKGAIDATEI